MRERERERVLTTKTSGRVGEERLPFCVKESIAKKERSGTVLMGVQNRKEAFPKTLVFRSPSFSLLGGWEKFHGATI